MNHRFNLLLFFLLGCAASQAATIKISMDQIPARVERSHPGLAAARWTIEEAKGRLTGAGRLDNPELELGFAHDRRFNEGNVSVALSQAFPLTARLRLEKKLGGQHVQAAELEVEDYSRKAIAEAQTLAVQLLSLEEQHKLRQQQLELAQTLSKFATDRAAAGEISALDAAQAQVDSQRLILEGRKVESERIVITGQLKAKLGVKPDDSLQLSGSLQTLDLPAKKTWHGRPDYVLSKTREQAAQTSVDLAKARKWQDWKAGVAWEGERAEDAPDGLEKTGFFGLQLSIPLPFWNKNQGEIAETTATAMKSIEETKALEFEISHEVKSLRDEMEGYAKLANETRNTLLPLVVEQSNRIEKAYEGGQSDLIELLRVREQRLQLEVAALEASRDFHLAKIRYASATGQHVSRKGVTGGK